MERNCQYCFLPFCQNKAVRSDNKKRVANSCSSAHAKLSTICWMNGCNELRFQYPNGKKAPGCCRGHTFKLKQVLKGKTNCDGSTPSTCDKCRPYDARDIVHSNLITGEDCYCYSCTC